MKKFVEMKCVPCEGGVKPFTAAESKEALKQVDEWELFNDNGVWKIDRTFEFKNFKETMAFVVKIALLAESEGHHPNFEIQWSKCKLILWTHAINGLFSNDFVLAAKTDKLYK